MEQQPWVIALTGPAGAGKSTTAAALARRLGAAVLDQDSITEPLVAVGRKLGIDKDMDPEVTKLLRDARYDCLVRAAADCSRAGVPSVLVAPFTVERRDGDAWERFASKVRRGGGRPRLAWLRIAPQDLARRLRQRSAESGYRVIDVDDYIRTIGIDAPVGPFIEVDATLPPDQQALHLRSALNSEW